jgi:ABC-2 type transport system permease protein
MNTRALLWSVRRELWENRSVYLAPLAVAVVIVLGTLAATMAHVSKVRLGFQPQKLTQPFEIAAGALMGTTMIVAIFYCLDALYGERRDRTILFWKSMPVSDLTSVLAKMVVPLVILPAVTFVITIATQFVMLLLSSAVLSAAGQSAAALWTKVPWLHMSGMLLYHLITVHSLYYAPIFGWLLLVSAWAKRLPFLWAFLPLALIGVLERIIFSTTHFGRMLGSRLGGGMRSDGTMLGHFEPLEFLRLPGLWIGLALAAACVAGAVRLRHYRDPI